MRCPGCRREIGLPDPRVEAPPCRSFERGMEGMSVTTFIMIVVGTPVAIMVIAWIAELLARAGDVR